MYNIKGGCSMKIIRWDFLSGFLMACFFFTAGALGMEGSRDKSFELLNESLLTVPITKQLSINDDLEDGKIAKNFQVTENLEAAVIKDEQSALFFERFPEDVWRKILSELKSFQDILRFSCVSREANPLCLAKLNNPPELNWKWVEGPAVGTLANYSWNKRIQQALSIALILHREGSNSRSSVFGENKEKFDIGGIKAKNILDCAQSIRLMHQVINSSEKECLAVRFFEQIYLKIYESGMEPVYDSIKSMVSLMDEGSLLFAMVEKNNSEPKVDKSERHYKAIESDTRFLSELACAGFQERQLLIFWDYIVNRVDCEKHQYFSELQDQDTLTFPQKFVWSNTLRKQLNDQLTWGERANIWNKIIEYDVDLVLSDLRTAAKINIKSENYHYAAIIEDKILKIKGHNDRDWLHAGRVKFLAKDFNKAAEIYNRSFNENKRRKIFKLEDLSYAAKSNFQMKNYVQAIKIFDQALLAHNKYLYSIPNPKHRDLPKESMKKIFLGFYHRVEDLILNARVNFIIKDYKETARLYGKVFLAQKELERNLSVEFKRDLLEKALTLRDLKMAYQANVSEKNIKAAKEISARFSRYSNQKLEEKK